MRVVQVTGEGEDVSQWAEEIDGTAKLLVADLRKYSGQGLVFFLK